MAVIFNYSPYLHQSRTSEMVVLARPGASGEHEADDLGPADFTARLRYFHSVPILTYVPAMRSDMLLIVLPEIIMAYIKSFSFYYCAIPL